MSKLKPVKKKIVADKKKRPAFSRILSYSPKTETLIITKVEGPTLEEFAEKKNKIRWGDLWHYADVFLYTPVPAIYIGEALKKTDISTTLLKACLEIVKITVGLYYHLIKDIGLKNFVREAKSIFNTIRFLRYQGIKRWKSNKPPYFSGSIIYHYAKSLFEYTNQLREYLTGKKLDDDGEKYASFLYLKLAEKYMNHKDFPAVILEDGFPWHLTPQGYIDPDRMGPGSLPFGIGCAFGFQSVYDKMNNPYWTLSKFLTLSVRLFGEIYRKEKIKPTQMDMNLLTDSTYFCSFFNNLRMAYHLSRGGTWHHKILTKEEAHKKILKLIDTARRQLNTLALFDEYARWTKVLFWEYGIFNKSIYDKNLIAEAELDVSILAPEEVDTTSKKGSSEIFTRTEFFSVFSWVLGADFEIKKFKAKANVKGLPYYVLMHFHIKSDLARIHALEDISFGPLNKTYDSPIQLFLPEFAQAGKGIERKVLSVVRPNDFKLVVDTFASESIIDMISVKNIRLVGKREGEEEEAKKEEREIIRRAVEEIFRTEKKEQRK